MEEFQDFKNEELYTNEGDKCTDKTCGGNMLVSYVSYEPETAVKTWTCERCQITESE